MDDWTIELVLGSQKPEARSTARMFTGKNIFSSRSLSQSHSDLHVHFALGSLAKNTKIQACHFFFIASLLVYGDGSFDSKQGQVLRYSTTLFGSRHISKGVVVAGCSEH